jgi:hypothetical protein
MQYFKNRTPNKLAVLEAKNGKTFITHNNKEYIFSFRKEGRKYIFIIEYKGLKMQVSESCFNITDTDTLLEAIEKEIPKTEIAFDLFDNGLISLQEVQSIK